MSRVIYDTLNRQQFRRLPKTDPPLEYREGEHQPDAPV
jgi:hypothetical protein